MLLLTIASALLPAPAADASFPGRNGNFAVTINCSPTSFGTHIELYGLRGRPIRSITPCGSETFGVNFSPSGKSMIYTDGPALVGTQQHFGHAATDGSGARRLPYGSMLHGRDGPSFAPDGRHVVFENVDDDTRELRVGTLGSSRTRLLGAWPHLVFDSPAWSPRGDTIVFHSGDPFGGALRFVDAGTGKIGRTIGHAGHEPDWSPDGRWITYARARIYVVRANGRRRHPITPAAKGVLPYSPVWAPNGRAIAWIKVRHSAGRADFSLWRVAIPHGEPRRVANLGYMTFDDEDGDFIPPDMSWQPRPRR